MRVARAFAANLVTRLGRLPRQAIAALEEAELLEILDHHRLGSQQTQSPITFINEVVGSSCTLVTEQFRRHGHKPSAPISGIIMGGIITDNKGKTNFLERMITSWTPKKHRKLSLRKKTRTRRKRHSKPRSWKMGQALDGKLANNLEHLATDVNKR